MGDITSDEAKKTFDKFCQGVELYSWSDKDKVEFAIAQKIPLSKNFVIKIMNNNEFDIVVAKLVRKDSGPKPASTAEKANATPKAADTVPKTTAETTSAKVAPAKKGPAQDSPVKKAPAKKIAAQQEPVIGAPAKKAATKTTKTVAIKETKPTTPAKKNEKQEDQPSPVIHQTVNNYYNMSPNPNQNQ
ncbi:hypothetical protein CRE_24968 [Caenorhabditis remanei]|uniref:Uncharacterized protein n=1 Tax=Caenorhabditis remanei TaxID=31234 RepID=E3MHP0_CAERE|nr:hypothetical protein CRE_24968 [Caenorhabditis remanei]